ncbi:TIGR02301 family protein [Pararhizobium antarcticum]|uniref:TIGR02301 family protein n=1 Tax=Pararhizobium antarcticum TaxID=1798805 RepID=A0A657LNC4_9HYPH|nr:TIGR02301 family protein [Pararhizobium antarcticum]OJF92889.1 hypothetical protein AX760_21925 [Pararhizobium antarcticum]OJF97732.1 hypothetical protein AX761_14160 [Rhizobium sp. 58]
MRNIPALPRYRAVIAALVFLSLSPLVWAQETPPAEIPADTAIEVPVIAEEKPAPYDPQLVRLSEILGSVQYLRTLCKGDSDDGWRQAMQQLIDREAENEVRRRERFTAAFNRGYRTFASVYTTCTAPAVVAEERYRAEGATLASEIVARFGN